MEADCRWLAITWVMWADLTNLKRMSASGGMERMLRVWWDGDPSERRRATPTCCRQISALTIRRGPGLAIAIESDTPADQGTADDGVRPETRAPQ